MKKLVLFFLLVGAVFVAGYASARWLHQRSVAAAREESFDHGFRPNPFPLQNRPFVVVVEGYNNGASVEKTLKSVFSQNYENFRIIYIDDGSNDGSYELARDLLYDSDHLLKVTLVRNEKRGGDLSNLVRAVEACADEEIVVVLAGNDWLAHEWVLQRLNGYYADPDLWLTYGSSRDFPTFQIGGAKAFKAQELRDGFRGASFGSFHLKTFYAALFRKIQEADLIFQGKFLSSELGYMIPLLEMGRDHFQYIPEILYICNRQMAVKEDREQRERSERFIRSLNPYGALSLLTFKSEEMP